LTLKGKADLVPALKKAFEYGNAAYDSTTWQNAAERVFEKSGYITCSLRSISRIIAM
jgi:hypothetical protein